MKIFAFPTDLPRRIAWFRRDQRGASAVEFALLLPLMLTLYFGSVELSHGVSALRKVTLTARTVADIAAQHRDIDNARMNDIMTAATAVISPFGPSQLKVTVSAVNIDAEGNGKVAWSDTFNGTARAVNSPVTLPNALKVPNSQVIISEVHYNYQPTIGYALTGTFDLQDKMYMSPRLSEIVNRLPS
jgi:Flp pilus assembly protein TadG